MSIFGMGSMYGSTEEKLPEFISKGHAFIGYTPEEAPALHQILKSIKISDIVFIKSFNGAHGLFIKAVGIVTGNEVLKDPYSGLGYGVPVKWIWVCSENDPQKKLGKLEDKMDNMRGGTLYEEFGPEVQKVVLDLLFSKLK